MVNNRIKYFFLAFSLVLVGCGGESLNDSNSSSSNNNMPSTGNDGILKGGCLLILKYLLVAKST